MEYFFRFLPDKKFSIKQKLKIFDTTRLQRKRWLTIIEQKIRQFRNGKPWQTDFFGNSLSRYKKETEVNEERLIRINKSIIQREFLENKN